MRTRLALLIFACLPLDAANRSEAEAQKTRLELRQQGFKTDLSDFDFSTTPEMQARVAPITNFTVFQSPWVHSGPNAPFNLSEISATVAPDAAMILWQQPILPSTMREDAWPSLRSAVTANRSDLAAARNAILQGPIAFNPKASQGVGMFVAHLPRVKSVAQMLAAETLLSLRDGQTNQVWSNLLATTRLTTAWNPEPTDVSLTVHHACAEIAYNLTWQTFQARIFNDAQLAELQREWSAVDFFRSIPEIAAFNRASYVAVLHEQRKEPLPTNSVSPRDIIRSPRDALEALEHRRSLVNYRDYGTFQDEKDLLLFYRDRETELRRAIKAPTWQQMRQLPGVTNVNRFQSKNQGASQMICIMNMKELALSSMRSGINTIGGAAESEARRRILLAAIALERHRLANSRYPNTLTELTHAAPNALIDFMDGKPLRYRATSDDRYVLYSIGNDCIDNEGTANTLPRNRSTHPLYAAHMFAPKLNTDIVWPRPGAKTEIEAHFQKVRADFKRFSRPFEERMNDELFDGFE